MACAEIHPGFPFPFLLPLRQTFSVVGKRRQRRRRRRRRRPYVRNFHNRSSAPPFPLLDLINPFHSWASLWYHLPTPLYIQERTRWQELISGVPSVTREKKTCDNVWILFLLVGLESFSRRYLAISTSAEKSFHCLIYFFICGKVPNNSCPNFSFFPRFSLSGSFPFLSLSLSLSLSSIPVFPFPSLLPFPNCRKSSGKEGSGNWITMQ